MTTSTLGSKDESSTPLLTHTPTHAHIQREIEARGASDGFTRRGPNVEGSVEHNSNLLPTPAYIPQNPLSVKITNAMDDNVGRIVRLK